MRGELDAFPTAWEMLPKDRIHHCHCKNAVKDDAGRIQWSPVDKGFINWTAQFRALHQAGFRDAVSLETHWRGGGTAEGLAAEEAGTFHRDVTQGRAHVVTVAADAHGRP